MSFYRFRHILFQKYLYSSLDPVERIHMHQQVGTTLQTLYGNETEEIAVQLAHHFQEAGTTGQAANYLNQAGDRASELIAYQEAIGHYQQAKTAYEESLGSKWDMVERATLERKIAEAFYRRGEHEQAQAHFEQALSYLGWPLPKSRWGIRLAILGEVIKQIGLQWLPRLFTKPSMALNELTCVSLAGNELRIVLQAVTAVESVLSSAGRARRLAMESTAPEEYAICRRAIALARPIFIAAI